MISLRPQYILLALLLLLACLATPSLATDDIIDDDDGDQRACVTLLQYRHYDCRGEPIAVRNNTVWQKEGMPCKHTARMKGHSVTDQYCSFGIDTDSPPQFHQKVFVYSKTCDVPWYTKAFSPIRLSYTQHGCTHGYRIAGCTKGACENPTTDTDEETDNAVEEETNNAMEEQ